MDSVFSVQRYLEDYINRQGLNDLDQYAVRLANLYDGSRSASSDEEFLGRMRRLRTVLFRNHPDVHRHEFERILLQRLDARFQKRGNPHSNHSAFPGGLRRERRRLLQTRRSIKSTLHEFKRAVEARAIDVFWDSRSDGRLRSRPEEIGQALLAVFLKQTLGASGLVLREVASGIGYVDVAVVFGAIPHLVEVKILKHGLSGTAQLATYMRTENRRKGWLLLLDARESDKKTVIPPTIEVHAGTIATLTVDINPTPPSRIVNR